VLIWQNRSILPGQTLTLRVTLRTLRATRQAVNCATYSLPPVQPSPGFTMTLKSPVDCASVAVRPLEGQHVAVYKRFTLPSNHVAKVGDWLSFETEWRNVGTETATRLDLYDAIVPSSVSKFLPLTFGFLWPFQSGDWAKITAAFKAQAPGWPAVNTAAWTATWADGSKTTTSAQDFVYIAEGDVVPRGLAVRKLLVDPLAGAMPGDLVSFHVAVTNTTGLTLTNVALYDTFDPQCFDFHDASLPPDSVAPGQVTWNNVGPLGPGDAVSIDVRLQAMAPCGLTRNCIRAEAAMPGGPTLTGVHCAEVELKGEQRPGLSLAKRRPQPGPVAVGTTFEWHLVVENTGGAPLATIPLSDLYDTVHLRFVSASPAPDAVDAAKGLLEWANVGPLQPGQQRTVVVRFEAIRPGLQVRNCAHSEYGLGSASVPLVDCDDVNIESPGPAIEVSKVLQYPPPVVAGAAAGALPAVGLGSTASYTVTVCNTGGQPLNAVNVVDHFDPGCLEFLTAPGMVTSRPQPDTLAWFIGLLNPGEERSWPIVFRTVAPCSPVANCASAIGRDPTGMIVEHETCVDIEITLPDPGIAVRKNLPQQQSMPGVGDVLVYQVMVQNTGNTALPVVPLWEAYDRSCLEFIDALPYYDWHDALAGQVQWQNVGPLLPGQGRTFYVLLRAIARCSPVTNCAWSQATDENQITVEAQDCIPAWIREGQGGGYRIYLPIVLKNHLGQP
jgi:uncharacterized repeat protein (TIGR01451 family)